MKIITISREFGSGGRELGKRIADILGFDYYDSEIISAVAKKSGVDENYIENVLDNHGWQDIPISFVGTIGSAGYMNASAVKLLVQQKKVIEEIAALGKDCVIVGRNADVILSEYKPFNIFVCAELSAKIERCMQRAKSDEKITERKLARKIKKIDRMRANTRTVLSGQGWGERHDYHLTVNTTDWQIKELAKSVAQMADDWFKIER
ncbi:MAG: cytidylate kinase-like family protein [Clostridia bacterium]|nr:cytidylate kinase-like family protein [Clostridia bacterium]